MNLEQWKVISEHDKSYDGKLFYGLKKGKVVYCPSWDIGPIEPDKIVVFTSLQDAGKFGYKLSKRCKFSNAQGNSTESNIVAQAQAFINQIFIEKFDLSVIAKQLFVNGSYLCRIFKKETGRTLLQYYNTVRCDYATELLTHSELGVAYIAAQTGFSSPSQFCHVFRKVVGKTPCQFRNDYFKSLGNYGRKL